MRLCKYIPFNLKLRGNAGKNVLPLVLNSDSESQAGKLDSTHVSSSSS